jgi:hypothetical protein
MLKRGRGVSQTLHKVARIAEKFQLDTQKIREKLIFDLQTLAEEIHCHAADRRKNGKAKREWARLEAYISQTISTIAKQYDVAKIREKLEELQRLVNVELGKGNEKA